MSGVADFKSLINHERYEVVSARVGLDIIVAEQLINDMLDHLQPMASPTFLHTLGIPGAGKSTFIKQQSFDNTLVLAFDSVMESIPAYQADKQLHGIDSAFKKWEICAREIGYEVLFRAIEKRLNIVFDNSGSRADHVDLLSYVKNNLGYHVTVAAFLIEEDLAFERAKRRDRYLPPEYIPERKKAIEALLPRYRVLADIYEEYEATPDGCRRIV